MNTIQNNDYHKTFCTLILHITAGISMFLTLSFMYHLGSSAGVMMAIAFALIGCVFDIVKSYSPTLIGKVFNKGHATVLLLGLISVALISISVSASVFSLQNGIKAALSQTKVSELAQSRLESLKSEINELGALQKKQLTVNQISKANATMKTLSQKRAELSQVEQKAATNANNSLLVSFSTPIILTIAIALEVISIAMTLVLGNLNKRTEESIQSLIQNETQLTASPVNKKVVKKKHVYIQSETIRTSTTSTISESLQPRESIIEDMKAALVKGECAPTYYSLYNSFRGVVKQKEIMSYFNELTHRGVIQEAKRGCYTVTKG